MLAGLRVLGADNSRIVFEHIKSLLAVCSVDAVFSADREEALLCVSEQAFDLVFVDWALNTVTLVDFVQVMKSLQGHARYVLMSPIDRDEHLGDMEAGLFDAVVIKPLMLSNIVDALLGRSNQVSKDLDLESNNMIGQLDLTGRRIWLVEDNLLNQELALALLIERGADVNVASAGNESLVALQRSEYAMVLMDCQLPNMDGDEATLRIRQVLRLEKVPMIEMTANVPEDD